jgi:hypothetical protein
MTLVTHFYRPRRARKKKAAVAPTGPRIVTIRRAPPPGEAELPVPSATEAQIPETPRAKPSSIVTAKKPRRKPYNGPAARDDDIDEAPLEQARAFLKRARRPPND